MILQFPAASKNTLLVESGHLQNKYTKTLLVESGQPPFDCFKAGDTPAATVPAFISDNAKLVKSPASWKWPFPDLPG